MERLTALIQQDRLPSLGVTEPGTIALATATARSHVPGKIRHITLTMTSGLYKNARTCGIPGTDKTGSEYSAALGVVAGDPEKGLMALEKVTQWDVLAAEKLVEAGLIEVRMSEVTSHLHLEAVVEADGGTAEVVIDGSHTNIVSIAVDGKPVFQKETRQEDIPGGMEITDYTIHQLLYYCTTVPYDEIKFLKEAYGMHLTLVQAGLDSDRAKMAKVLMSLNSGRVFSQDVLATAQVLTGAAVEARVIGLPHPAMSITGSGAHGIICTMPLYAAYKCKKLEAEQLCRATALSYLVTMYLKAYSGKLSAFCGCGIAAGTGVAAALTYLLGGGIEEISCTIFNMASGITGMICDGGNIGCVVKATAALDAAYKAAMMGLKKVAVGPEHGINGKTIEETLQNIGRIADPGMRETERTILELMEQK